MILAVPLSWSVADGGKVKVADLQQMHFRQHVRHADVYSLYDHHSTSMYH